MSDTGAGDLPPGVADELLDRLREVLSITNTIVWEADLERGDADYFGPVEDVTGLSRDALGDPFTVAERTIHPEDRSAVVDAFEDLLVGDAETIDLEYRTHPDNGPVRWIRSQAFLEGAPGGGTLVGFSTEVTPLKEKEARLDEFVGIVSHDLRNPLSVATGRLELAREERDSEDLEVAATALERMEGLIEDTLTLARHGETIGEVEALDLATVVEECWGTVETGAADLDLPIDRTILADRSRLRQLLENLVRNAVEHGGEDVTVTVGPLEDGFFVADDGVGIPEDVRGTHLRRGEFATDRPGGLGLRIVEEVADAHDWAVSVTESDSGGARFEFTGVESP